MANTVDVNKNEYAVANFERRAGGNAPFGISRRSSDGAGSARNVEALRTEATRGDFRFGWKVPIISTLHREL
jgi:hypothetical protein